MDLRIWGFSARGHRHYITLRRRLGAACFSRGFALRVWQRASPFATLPETIRTN